jgi:hypothetical protein
MHRLHVSSFGLAIILSTLLMGVLGAFVLIPIAFIQWGWNTIAATIIPLPAINVWQAILLYLAFGNLLFLSGLRIEVKAEKQD